MCTHTHYKCLGYFQDCGWSYVFLFVCLVSVWSCVNIYAHYYKCFVPLSRFVYVWDAVSRRILYKLPGHRGSVNDVDFHPKEPICEFCVHRQHSTAHVCFQDTTTSICWFSDGPSISFIHVAMYVLLCHMVRGLYRSMCPRSTPPTTWEHAQRWGLHRAYLCVTVLLRRQRAQSF